MNMPPSDINKLVGWVATYPSFAKDILDEDKRHEALNEFQNPNKLNPMYGVGTKPKGGQLNPREIETLMGIKAETPEEFAKGCIEAGLADNPGQSPESGR